MDASGLLFGQSVLSVSERNRDAAPGESVRGERRLDHLDGGPSGFRSAKWLAISFDGFEKICDRPPMAGDELPDICERFGCAKSRASERHPNAFLRHWLKRMAAHDVHQRFRIDPKIHDSARADDLQSEIGAGDGTPLFGGEK